MSKQDRQGARTVPDLERKYNFGKSFAEAFNLAEDAQRAASNAQNSAEEALKIMENLDHDEIFNLLTNDGELEGIYRGEDGEIYINATYIKSGVINADLIKAGTLRADVVRLQDSPDERQHFATLDELNDYVLAVATDMEVNTQKTISATFDGCFDGMRHEFPGLGFGTMTISTGLDIDSMKSATAIVSIDGQVSYNNLYSEGVDDNENWVMELGDWVFLDTPITSYTPSSGSESYVNDGVECYYRWRYNSNTGEYEQEWVNPPMMPGVEYRTSERWRGKPVYVMMHECGVLPSKTTKSYYLPVNIAASQVVSLEGHAYNGSYWSMPVYNTGSIGAYIGVRDGGEIYARAVQSMSDCTLTVVVKYIKN